MEIYHRKTQPHKRFFREPTKAEIKGLSLYKATDNLVDRIRDLGPLDGLVIARPVTPTGYSDARKFLKHGTEVTVGSTVEEAFNSLSTPYNTGYVFRPETAIDLRDNRTRKVGLVECLEGARLVAYSDQVAGEIEVGHYHRARAVAKDGATVPVRVPSRRQKMSRYAFDLVSVPVLDNDHKDRIAQEVSTRGHDCARNNWWFRYSTSLPSNQVVFCAHEVAAYHQAAEELKDKGRNVPTEMSPFVRPTGETVIFYKRLLDSVLIEDETIQAKDKLRKLNKAEEEIMLWGLVYKKGFGATFSGNGQMKQQNWELSPS